jgi:hypothetical protein
MQSVGQHNLSDDTICRTTQSVGQHNLSDDTTCQITKPVGRHNLSDHKIEALIFCRLTQNSSNAKCVSSDHKFVFCVKKKTLELSPWSDWSACSKSCGTGDRTRTRNCILKDCPICAYGRDEKNPCNAALFERQLCNQQVRSLFSAVFAVSRSIFSV